MFDLVIRGGTVVDGSGRPPVAADVAISNGRVETIGTLDAHDCRVIDAAGRVVAPGFIDIHTHYDAQAVWDGTFSPSPLHGFTTIVAGNCGFSIAPLGDQKDYIMRALAHTEGMSLGSLQAVPWEWSTTADYLDHLEGNLATNAGFMVGHSTIRRVVMRDDSVLRAATEDELVAMERLLHEGIEAGGLGFSSSLAEGSYDDDGNLIPSRLAGSDELVRLSRAAGEHPGTSLELVPTNGRYTEPHVHLMTRMSAAANRPLNWNALSVFVDGRARVEERLAANDYAAAHGARLLGLLLPTPSWHRYSFLTPVQFRTFPGWLGPMALPLSDRIKLLSDPGERRRLDEQAQLPENIMVRFANWATYIILDVASHELRHYQGRTVADIADDEGKDPFDALLDIVVADGLRTGICTPLWHNSDDDWRYRVEIARDPRVVLGASDAGAHLDTMTRANYSTVFIENAVRRLDLLPLEAAVHLMTDVPARLYGIKDRGVLTPGAWADVVIFDPATIGSTAGEVRYDLPGGAMRVVAEGVGIDAVLVNGTEIVSNGTFTHERPGAVLRSGRDTAGVTVR